MALASSSIVTKALMRSEEHTSELQSRLHLVCRLLLEKKKVQIVSGLSGRAERSARSLILAHGGTSAIWIGSNLPPLSFPAVFHSTPNHSFLACTRGGV